MNNVTSPTLIVDREKCQKKIARMVEKIHKKGLKFRPHFKTHQSSTVGNWYKAMGVNAITVSSIKMARYFMEAGWKDITVAFPVNVLEIEEINEIATRIQLNLLAVNKESITLLAEKEVANIGLYIEIDTGYHRTGILAENEIEIAQVVEEIRKNPQLNFKGFLAHAGHSYNCHSREEILKVHEDTRIKMVALKEKFSQQGTPVEISIGDTPCISLAEDFEGIDEVRPGNFVYYDLMQTRIGSCSVDQISVAIACPVVALYPERNEVIIYGGGIHFSKDYITDNNGTKIYGKVVELNGDGWTEPMEGTYLKSLSQEHGILKVSDVDIENFKVGNIVLIIPAHCCLAANLLKNQQTLEGEILKVIH